MDMGLKIEIPEHLNRHELFVPALKDLCVKVVAENFVIRPSFGTLNAENKAKVICVVGYIQTDASSHRQ